MATGATEFFDKTLLRGTAGGTEGTHIGEVWSKFLLVSYEKAAVLLPLVDRKYEREVPPGDIIHVQDVPKLAVRSFTVNTAITYETTAPVNLDIVVNTTKYAAFAVEKPVKTFSNIDIRKAYYPKLAAAIATDLDSAVASLFSGFANITGAYATDVDEDIILDAKRLLDVNDVPESPRYLVLPPIRMNALRKIERFSRAEYTVAKLGDLSKPRPNGYIGAIHGFSVIQSNNLTTSGSSIDGAAFHQEALAVVVGQKPEVEEMYDLDYFVRKVGAQYVYGTKEMRDTSGVFIKC